LRFEFGGKVFTFSGDSVKSDGLQKACQNADLFICDASYQKGKGSPAHLDTVEIGELAGNGICKKVVLTHFFPATESIDLVAEVKESFSGEVVRGEDLMEVEV
jgi:ribonuclease BN (tRNA processing enzyme)